jgi:hypothetical protein
MQCNVGCKLERREITIARWGGKIEAANYER